MGSYTVDRLLIDVTALLAVVVVLVNTASLVAMSTPLTVPLKIALPVELIVAAVPSTLFVNANPFPVRPVFAVQVPP